MQHLDNKSFRRIKETRTGCVRMLKMHWFDTTERPGNVHEPNLENIIRVAKQFLPHLNKELVQ